MRHPVTILIALDKIINIKIVLGACINLHFTLTIDWPLCTIPNSSFAIDEPSADRPSPRQFVARASLASLLSIRYHFDSLATNVLRQFISHAMYTKLNLKFGR